MNNEVIWNYCNDEKSALSSAYFRLGEVALGYLPSTFWTCSRV